jgi:hypothetical protein
VAHPNLSYEINRNIAKSEIEGGCFLFKMDGSQTPGEVLPVGKTLLAQTKNTLYRIEKRSESDYYISGHPRYCPEPTKSSIHGSTWGGSMLKVGFVGRGMHLEFSTPEHGTITTSEIQDVREA